jgi:hypothetical protein
MLKEATTQTKDKWQVMHETPSDLNREGVAEITAELRRLGRRFRTVLEDQEFPAYDGTAFPGLSPSTRRTR